MERINRQNQALLSDRRNMMAAANMANMGRQQQGGRCDKLPELVLEADEHLAVLAGPRGPGAAGVCVCCVRSRGSFCAEVHTQRERSKRDLT